MLKFMKNKILIPLLVVGALGAFFSFRYGGEGAATPEERRAIIIAAIMKAVGAAHYSPRPIDDTFSARVYNRVVNLLDYDKLFFTQEDMNKLSKYQYAIDEEIKNNSVEFFDTINAIYVRRVSDGERFSKQALAQPFTFKGEDSIQLNADKLPYAANDAQLADYWRQFIKYRTLTKLVDMEKDQDKKHTDSPDVKLKTSAQLEQDARAAVSKAQDFWFKRLKKMNEEKRFEYYYAESIAFNEDPHTDYFPVEEKKSFDEGMSGKFYGIGAQLKEEESGKIKVVAIISGSPSWKQGELKAGDEIEKVAQGNSPAEDIEGMELDDVVRKIKGPKGTEVRLTVKKESGATKVISIIRDAVTLESTFAKSAVINSPEGAIGYIYLPEFYADFLHADGRRCATDIEAELKKLKEANVKGVILDLRNNGGGSLNDVVDMAGLFVGKGPVVQVKDRNGKVTMLPSPATAPLYTGPLAIMVNQNSASASEIMAAAMQDYGRAVIVGTPTYGKGTVQKIIPLDEVLDATTRMRLQEGLAASTLLPRVPNESNPEDASIGSLKLTMQKFYRVNGGSTQRKGVIPDIVIPDRLEDLDEDLGERHEISALPWDQIAAADYKPTNSVGNLNQLRTLSKGRVDANPYFKLVDKDAAILKNQRDNTAYSLNEVDYKKQTDEINELSKQMEEAGKKSDSLSLTNLAADLPAINTDSTTAKKNKDWLKALSKDQTLYETVNIMSDMSKQSMNVNNIGTGMK
jgi:carboxyl-terminal processing protease